MDGLTGIRFSHSAAKDGLPPIEFEAGEPVYVLVGYFDSKHKAWLQVPKLEFAAQADERGGVDTVLENAATIASCPNVNLHAFRFDAGKQKLELIGKGSFVVLGVVPQTVKFRNATSTSNTEHPINVYRYVRCRMLDAACFPISFLLIPPAAEPGVVDTTSSPFAKVQTVGLDEARWTRWLLGGPF